MSYSYASPWLKRFKEMPQLHSRKFTETLRDLLRARFQEDPAGGPLVAGRDKVDPATHGGPVLRRFGFEVDVPAALPPAQLTHVTRVIPAGERIGHAVQTTLPQEFLPVRFLAR